jgi:hypothetical protein
MKVMSLGVCVCDWELSSAVWQCILAVHVPASSSTMVWGQYPVMSQGHTIQRVSLVAEQPPPSLLPPLTHNTTQNTVHCLCPCRLA